ncbi:histone acetyltransferase 1 [Coemansia sp. RSA 989]|nr:acyl-CoA N-acyltransferase [Coemansia mojavensis]KAJ1741222.1 histone acetyltransferase 1 [Coemansia sp. RSA 1086]KAJ1751518.1 histone acetyltransferase 1 [Coemansia sp. RSA 1821]KAJ1866210.1 histone acetyltransferase 1 [Coemansia sp. RSA 989]KAJ1873439.1 histone acetyltransferase 1 [Coemansia sp. RSA 990]KAJ2670029.1 histone acetyltransferase 1 [Coemansia sp. RSA 1085]
MDPQVAASLSQWATESNSAVFISLVSGETADGVVKALSTDLAADCMPEDDEDGADVIQFHPAFTYPIYGEHERIFGYKGLRIQLSYAAGSLATLLEVDYAKRIEQMDSTLAVPLKADDVDGPMRSVLAQNICSTREEFAQRVALDTQEFRPIGQKVHEYKAIGEAGGNEQLRYEIYESGFESSEFRAYHERMQTLVLFFIEGAQFIDMGDERWRVFTVFERLDVNGVASYSLVGFCTMYRFYHWPDRKRPRISQFLILPPFQGHGHGSSLYRFIYSMVLASPEYADLSVEDPSEAFDDMRDRNDMRYLLKHKAFDHIKCAPVSRSDIVELQRKFKLSLRQMTRCLEIALLQKIKSESSQEFRQLRLFIKKRIYAQNTDLLQDLDADDKKQKVAESFAAVIDDYRRILSLI